MKDASQYPVEFPYGATSSPYGTTANPYHRGEDRFTPVGTSVIVNGVEIGKTDTTGWVTGPHLHIGRFVGGKDTNPNGGGFNLPAPVTVTTVSEDSTNGKYVRLTDAQGVQWVYLHLQSQSVTQGQQLKGEDMGQIQDLQNQVAGLQAELEGERKGYQELLDKANGLETELTAERASYDKTIADLKAQLAASGQTTTVLKPGKYQVN